MLLISPSDAKMAASSQPTKTSVITGPIPRYRKLYEGDRWQPGADDEWNPDLPYGGKVYLARKKKERGWIATILEVTY